MQPLKVCRDCGKTAFSIAELDGFVKGKRAALGRVNWCKSCRSRYDNSVRTERRLRSGLFAAGGYAYCIPVSVAEAWANAE